MFFNTARLATRTAHPKVLRPSFLARLYAQRVVSFHYTLTNQSGAPLDSSRVPGRAPLTFLEGSGQIIPGLETEITKLGAGDKRVVTVPAKEAYGEYRDNAVFKEIPKERFPEGDSFQISLGEQPTVVTVLEITETTVTLDANHPLAGQDLIFDVEITETRDATEEEISHGHVHGPGGHHH